MKDTAIRKIFGAMDPGPAGSPPEEGGGTQDVTGEPNWVLLNDPLLKWETFRIMEANQLAYQRGGKAVWGLEKYLNNLLKSLSTVVGMTAIEAREKLWRAARAYLIERQDASVNTLMDAIDRNLSDMKIPMSHHASIRSVILSVPMEAGQEGGPLEDLDSFLESFFFPEGSRHHLVQQWLTGIDPVTGSWRR